MLLSDLGYLVVSIVPRHNFKVNPISPIKRFVQRFVQQRYNLICMQSFGKFVA